MNKNDNKYANKIANAFLKNKIISPLPPQLLHVTTLTI